MNDMNIESDRKPIKTLAEEIEWKPVPVDENWRKLARSFMNAGALGPIQFLWIISEVERLEGKIKALTDYVNDMQQRCGSDCFGLDNPEITAKLRLINKLSDEPEKTSPISFEDKFTDYVK